MAEFRFKAIYLAQELVISKVKEALKYKLVQEKRERLVYEAAPKKYIFIYSFGAVVFYDIDEKIQNDILKAIKSLKLGEIKNEISEEYLVIEHSKNSVEFNHIRLKSIDMDKLKLIALILAQSVALENYEIHVEKIIDSFSVLNKQLKEEGKLKVSDKELMKIIGTNSSIIEIIISKLALLEKPASTWENEENALLFNRLHIMFEIGERFKHIEYKIDFIESNSELMINILNQHRANFLEIIIIGLFILDLIVIIYEMFFFK